MREHADWHPESEDEDPAGNPECESFTLREVVKHIRGVRAGVHTLADFADFYCLEFLE